MQQLFVMLRGSNGLSDVDGDDFNVCDVRFDVSASSLRSTQGCVRTYTYQRSGRNALLSRANFNAVSMSK